MPVELQRLIHEYMGDVHDYRSFLVVDKCYWRDLKCLNQSRTKETLESEMMEEQMRMKKEEDEEVREEERWREDVFFANATEKTMWKLLEGLEGSQVSDEVQRSRAAYLWSSYCGSR